MTISALILDLSLSDLSSPASPLAILGRTLPRNLASGSVPILKLAISSASEGESGSMKESRIQLELAGFTYHLSPDSGWIDDVVRFSKAPEGVSPPFFPLLVMNF